MAVSKSTGIPKDSKQETLKIVEDFNKEHKERYQVSFRGQFCYLSRIDDRRHEAFSLALAAKLLGFSSQPHSKEHLANTVTQIGRLKWGGDMQSWDFAVYKYSRDNYDPDEIFFPGADSLDGTILSALSAGRKIYP